MDEILAALAAQQAVLAGLLDGLSAEDWERPSRCEGWSVADVVIHVAQTNELGIASAQGRLAEGATTLGWVGGPGETVDDLADRAVVQERGTPGAEVGERWRTGAAALRDALAACDPSARVQWVAGMLSARTLATTRLAETWIHTGDVAEALGRSAATDGTAPEGLPHIARLAWRTLPYAFARAGRELAGPVAVSLGDVAFVPDDGPAVTTVEGDLLDWCMVAARRADPATTSLRATGPDAESVLELVRTYA